MMPSLSPDLLARFAALPGPQQALLFASGAFAPHTSFSPAALLSVWQDRALNADEIAALESEIAALIPHFLTGEGPQLRHAGPHLHAYALQHLQAEGRAEAAHRQHLRYYQRASETWFRSGGPHLRDNIAQYDHAIAWARLNDYEHLLALILAGAQALVGQVDYYPQAAQWLAQARDLVLAKGEAWGMAGQMRSLGEVATAMGEYALARDFYFQALTRWGEAGLAGQAHTFKSLGDLSLAENDLSAARGFYHKALVLYEVVNFKLGQANAQKQLGQICYQLKEGQAALAYYEKAIALYSEMGFDLEHANSLKDLGDLYTKHKNYPKAADLYEQAEAIYAKIEFWTEQAASQLALGQLQGLQGQWEAAWGHYERALALYEKASDHLGQAKIRRARGNLYLDQGNWGPASKELEQAHRFYFEHGALGEAALLQLLLANLAVDQGELLQAVKWMRDSSQAMEALPEGVHRHEVKVGMQRLAHSMGRAFPALWEEATGGQALPQWLAEHTQTVAQVEGLLRDGPALGLILRDTPAVFFDLLARLPEADRLESLNRAIALAETQTPPDHYGRALLLKELAGQSGQETGPTLHAALGALEAALAQTSSPADYSRVQNRRVALMRDMAGMRGESRAKLLKAALEVSEAALEQLRETPDYARTQFNRANLLRELAGLKGEDRAEWMLKALAAYEEVLAASQDPLERATTQTNLASLLIEIADLEGQDRAARIAAAQAAAQAALQLCQAGEGPLGDYARVAERMLANVNLMATT